MLREGVLMSATKQIKMPGQLGWAKSYKTHSYMLYVAFLEFIHDHLITFCIWYGVLELDGHGPIKIKINGQL